jgi:hypothetical protein
MYARFRFRAFDDIEVLEKLTYLFYITVYEIIL